jgi:hypothetical protein
MDEEEVNRVLDALCAQGNAEEVSIWVWTHICCGCQYKKDEKK